jgi:hypothetical protein
MASLLVRDKNITRKHILGIIIKSTWIELQNIVSNLGVFDLVRSHQKAELIPVN